MTPITLLDGEMIGGILLSEGDLSEIEEDDPLELASLRVVADMTNLPYKKPKTSRTWILKGKGIFARLRSNWYFDMVFPGFIGEIVVVECSPCRRTRDGSSVANPWRIHRSLPRKDG